MLAGLDRSLIERTTHARVALLALLAGHHVLLIGPPGTAKSMLARALCACVREARFFEYLLSKFTHPDELFGPVSIPGLKEEDYRRLTDGYLPRAHIAFLDEIFKANSAILNSLLTLINERVFHHGRRRDAVPLLGLVGASNELPEAGAGLQALHDRFLVRLAVPPIQGDQQFLQVILGEHPAFRPAEEERLTVAEIRRLRELAAAVSVSAPVRQALLRIREKLQGAGVETSDRRWRWAIELLRLSAVTGKRRELSMLDLCLLEYCFGDPTEAEGVVRNCVRDGLSASAHGEDVVEALKRSWTELQAKKIWIAFDRWAPEMVARVDSFIEQCDRASGELDGRLGRLEAEQKQTPWLTDVPAELVTGLLAARMKIQQYKAFAATVRRTITEYHPAELVHDHVKQRAEGWYHQNAAIYLRVAGRSDGPWIGLHDGGRFTVGEPRGDAPQLELDDAAAHSLIFHTDAQAVVKSLTEAALRPLVAQPSAQALAHQARRFQALTESCTQALRRCIESLAQQGVRPPALPPLPEPAPATETKHAKPRVA